MRRKKIPLLTFTFPDKNLPKIVAFYRQGYKASSRILDVNPEILNLAHRDLATLSQESKKGRSGDFTYPKPFCVPWWLFIGTKASPCARR